MNMSRKNIRSLVARALGLVVLATATGMVPAQGQVAGHEQDRAQGQDQAQAESDVSCGEQRGDGGEPGDVVCSCRDEFELVCASGCASADAGQYAASAAVLDGQQRER